MSPDLRILITGYLTLAAGVLHLAAVTHHHGGALHLGGLVAVGLLQVVAGAALLQQPAPRLMAVAVALGGGSAVAYAVESAAGAHHVDALGIATSALGLAVAILQLRKTATAIAAAGLVTAAAVSVGPAVFAADESNQPDGCTTPNRRMTLYAEQLPSSEKDRIRLGWGLTRGTATSPGPLIEMVEGDCLAITVVNDIPKATLETLRRDPADPLGVSLHVHGVKYTTSSDGTLMNTPSIVPPGGSRTYIWYAAPRVVTAGRVTSLGTAGTWWYHDHVVGTPHGTEGVAAGLAGGLVVRRPSDLVDKPDKTFTVVMGPKHEINFGLPTDFHAEEGELVEFVVIGAGTNFHTFHLHGHNWADTRTGLADPVSDIPLIDAKTVGPSESFGFQVRAGESVGDGHWMLHCHVQDHSDQGMSTAFVVDPADGDGADDPAPSADLSTDLTHSH